MKKKIEELLRLAMKVQEKTSAYVSFETSNHGWECVVMIMDDGFEINHGYDGWYEMDIFYPDERLPQKRLNWKSIRKQKSIWLDCSEKRERWKWHEFGSETDAGTN